MSIFLDPHPNRFYIFSKWRSLILIVLGAIQFTLFVTSHAKDPTASQRSTSMVVLAKGHQTFLKIQGSGSVTVGNSKVIGVKDFGDRILITGRSLGETLVTVGSKEWRVFVISKNEYRSYHELAKEFDQFLGLTLKIVGGKVEIGGELLRLSDWLRIAELSPEENGYHFRAQIDATMSNRVKLYFNRLFGEAELPPLQMVHKPYFHFIYEGENEDLRKRYETLFAKFGIDVLKDVSHIKLEPMVKVQITVAEVKKKEFQRMGIKWKESYQAEILPQLAVESPLAMIEALEEKGLGRVLASPNILCRSGKEAEFLAGGEFPIKITGFAKRDVIWKKHGILLTVKPLADFRGRMSIGIKSEVSAIDESQVVDGVPGLKTNRIESHFDLDQTRTIALSGLIKNEWGKSRQGIPLLGDIPILGKLFSSEDYRNQQTELMVFVTPSVLKGMELDSEGKLPEGF